MDIKDIIIQPKSWEILQDPLLLKIFRELSINDVLTCSEVCFNWNRVSQDDLLWKYLFQRDFFRQESINKIDRNEKFSTPLESSWKSEYERIIDRNPRKRIQILHGHKDEVVHVAFSNDGMEFVSCSKDQSFIVWKKKTEDLCTKFECHHQQDMAVYNWLQTYSSQYSPSDTKLLVSGVSNEGGGEIAIFLKGNNRYSLTHRVRNDPFDLMGCWTSDSTFISGSIVWNENNNSFMASIWICSISTTSSIIEDESYVDLIDPIPEDIDFQGNEDDDSSNNIDKEELFRYRASGSTNSPHFIQFYSNQNQIRNMVQRDLTDTQTNNENNNCLSVEDPCLIFVCGDKTYVGHQIGFQKLLKESNEKYSKPLKILEMDGQIVGMKISPHDDYVYVNVRPWESDASPDLSDAPRIGQNIEVRKINIKTMEIEEGKENNFTGHNGFTPMDGAFYMYIDVSKNFLASGSEDSFGYIWEANYGVLLEKLGGHSKCVNCVVFDPIDEETCVTGSDDHTLQVFTSNRKNRATLNIKEK